MSRISINNASASPRAKPAGCAAEAHLDPLRTGRHGRKASRVDEPELLPALLFFQIGCQLGFLLFLLQLGILLPQYFGVTENPCLLLFPNRCLIDAALVLGNLRL